MIVLCIIAPYRADVNHFAHCACFELVRFEWVCYTTDRMKRTIPVVVTLVLDALHFLALTLWLGGLLTLWLALMPAAFGGAGLTTRAAEAVTGETLRRFAPIVEACGIVMIVAQLGLRFWSGRERALFLARGLRQTLTLCALLLAEVCLRSVLPGMDAARRAAHVAEFHGLHQGYTALATLETLLLLGVSLLTVWLHQSRPASIDVS